LGRKETERARSQTGCARSRQSSADGVRAACPRLARRPQAWAGGRGEGGGRMARGVQRIRACQVSDNNLGAISAALNKRRARSLP
jgi:hypothetical protein